LATLNRKSDPSCYDKAGVYLNFGGIDMKSKAAGLKSINKLNLNFSGKPTLQMTRHKNLHGPSQFSPTSNALVLSGGFDGSKLMPPLTKNPMASSRFAGESSRSDEDTIKENSIESLQM
jgi:hypothetical protein